MDTNENRQGTVKENNPEPAGTMGSKLKEKARAVQETAQQWQQQATEATRKAARATDDYVRENPWNALAYVAVGCFVFGFLLGRSRGSSSD